MVSRRAMLLPIGLWLVAALSVLLPAHQAHHAAHAAHAAHALAHRHDHAGHEHHHHDHHDHGDAPTHGDADTEHCSTCELATHLVTTPPLQPVTLRPETVEVADARDPATFVAARVLLPFHGRAPPQGA